MENSVDIKEVMINEDFLHPEHESIAIGFTNNNSSGLIEMTPREIEKLINSINRKKHLIKGMKIFKEK